VGLTGNTSATNSFGIVFYSNFKATKVGTYYVMATSGNFNSSCSSEAMTVNAASLSSLSFTGQPSGSVAAGSAFTFQPIVLGLDSFGNAVSASVTLSAFTDPACSTAGAGAVSSGTTLTNSSGYAVFSGTSYNRAQTIYMKAISSKCTR
jgi:hypothetical protein